MIEVYIKFFLYLYCRKRKKLEILQTLVATATAAVALLLSGLMEQTKPTRNFAAFHFFPQDILSQTALLKSIESIVDTWAN